MPAGMLYFAILCLPLGVALYVNTFVAQYEGAGRPERIGLSVWHGVRIGVFAFPLFLATIPLAPTFFRLAGHSPQVAHLEVIYYQVVTFGAGGMLISAALATFFTGRGQTRVVMLVDCTAVALNLGLDYLWIFGRLGFPALGIEGAAWATVVAQWFKVLVYWRLMMRPVHRHKYGLVSGRRFDPALFRRILYYGGPNGMQLLVEVAAFSFFILLVGRLGADAMAATTLAFNVNSVAFIPMIGLGIAVTTMVGQQLGRDRPDLAARATWTALAMALVYMGTLAVSYVVVPDAFMFGHAAGISADEFAALRDTTVVLLRFVAAYCLFDACLIIFTGAIKGAGDTRFILLTELVMAPLPVVASWVGVRFFGAGLWWCWAAVTAWIWGLGMVFLARFLQGRWRRMRVIEPEPDEPAIAQPPLAPVPVTMETV